MKIVAISDTHGKHQDLVLPTGDMIIHAGDVSRSGKKREILDFLNWYTNLDFKYKIFIAGNHDFYFEDSAEDDIKSIIPENIIYLNDSGVTIEGINIWGSPIQPWFLDWAFNRERGEVINKHWNLIPEQTNILITHGPAMGILDKTIRNEAVGCADLLKALERVKPEYFIFGHIHEAYGQEEYDSTTCINASVLDVRYRLRNEAVVFEV